MLFQVVSKCSMLFSVFRSFLVVLACFLKLFHMFLPSSCVFQLDFSCFSVVECVSGSFTLFLVVLQCSWSVVSTGV